MLPELRHWSGPASARPSELIRGVRPRAEGLPRTPDTRGDGARFARVSPRTDGVPLFSSESHVAPMRRASGAGDRQAALQPESPRGSLVAGHTKTVGLVTCEVTSSFVPTWRAAPEDVLFRWILSSGRPDSSANVGNVLAHLGSAPNVPQYSSELCGISPDSRASGLRDLAEPPKPLSARADCRRRLPPDA